MKVAWIGMGRIGKQMALRVLAGGHALVGHARDPSRHGEIAAAGGVLKESAAEAVAQAEIVCVNVYDEEQLRNVMFDHGALAAMASRARLVIHSTVGPTLIRQLARSRDDIAVVDAAFSGTDRDAANGTIALMAGGEAGALEGCRPVLETYANFIRLLGPVGSGMTAKLVNNALFGAQMLLAHDALRVLTGSGIDKDLAVETLSRSSGGSFAMGLFGPGVDPDERMAGIGPYMTKDVAAARAAATEAGIDLGMLDIGTRPFIGSA